MLRNLSRSNVDDVQVVIPMAGKSQRFFDAGYDQPKFLIEFFGLPMIGHILRIFQNFPDVIVIVNEQDKIKYDLGSVVSKLHGTAKVVSIKQHSFGPSYSILESSEFINQSKKIIVHYCDFSGAWDPYDTVDLLNTYNGVFVSFTGFHPSRINGTKFAYGRASSEKALMEIKEKGSFTADPETEYASSGIYGFSTGGLMLESIGEQVRLNLQINGEFYTSLTHEIMLRNKKSITMQNMSLFYAWGTPENLENFIYYVSICKDISGLTDQNAPIVNHNGVVLAAGKSSRLRLAGEKPKQSKLFAGKKVLIDFSKKLISQELNTFLVATSEIYPKNIWNLPKTNLEILTHASESQIASVQIGLGLIKDKTIPITFLASDNIMFFENEKQLDLSIATADMLVWTCGNYPFAQVYPEQYSWVKINDDNTIESALYKESPKELRTWKLITGNFTFRSHNIVSSLIEGLEGEIGSLQREPILDDLVGVALKMGYNVRAFDVAKYMTLGSQLENKIFDYFNEIYNYEF